MDKKAIGAVLGALVLIVAAFFFGGYNKVTNDDAQMMIDDAVAASEAQAAQDLADAQAVHDAELAAEQAATQALSDQVAGLNAELDEVKAELAAMQQTAAEQEAEEAELGQCRYVMDGLGIDVAVSDEELSDRELECALFDGDIEWDGDDYEAEEVLALTGLYLGSNYEDFGSDVCLELEAEKVYYSFVVDADLNTSLIDADEMLEFSLLGEDVKLSKWEDCDTITFFKGSKHRVNEGDSLTVEYDGESYTIYFAVITDDSVFVEVGADSDEIDEGNSRMVGGLDIMVDSVLENEAGEPTPDMAIIYVGNDVEITVEDGDEYAKDSPWEWDIGCNEIGLRLVEDYDEPDDEDYPALCAESELCLPNDFLCIKYDGLAEEDYFTYDLDLDSGMSRVQGDFELGIEDYDEVWCDNSAMFWSDEDKESGDELNTSVLGLKGSDVTIECVAPSSWPWIAMVCFNGDGKDVCIANNFNSIGADGAGIGSEDEDYITDYGIIVEVPEDCLDDDECTVRVPAERMEGSITVYLP